MSEQKNVSLPADESLTSKNFSLNSDGTVTIKNSDLTKLLHDKFKNAVADPTVSTVGVAITVG